MSSVERRIYAIISFIMLIVIGSGILVYEPRDPNLLVLDEIEKKGRTYWVTLKEITHLEQGNCIMTIWYHNGTIDVSAIDFSHISTTLVGYEKVYYQSYRGFTIIDDHMDGLNTKIDTVHTLLDSYNRRGKLTW